MTAGLEAAGLVELAVVERSGLIESRHLGAAVVVDPAGAVAARYGDIDGLIYPRSTLKLLQAVAVQRAGLRLEGAELVLSAASHLGTGAHLEVVRAILERGGVDESALRCPAQWPADAASRHASAGPSAIAMGCSGKHAAFLAVSAANGWPLETYLDSEHPLQRLVLEVVEELSGETVRHSGIDGCGAPVHALTLVGLARGVQSALRDPDGARLGAAIVEQPWALDNPQVASLIRATGLVAKSGAEGVLVAGAPDGTTVALKVADGSERALVAVGLRLLAAAGAVDADLAERVAAESTAPVLGGGEVVGRLRATVG